MENLPVASLMLVFLPLQISTASEFLCCDGDIQLFGGSVLNEGRVELCLSGQWKTVCDNNWGDSEAQVVCKQLGYSHKGVVPLTATNYGQGSMASATVEFVECDGTEKRLVDCTIRDGPNSQCTHSGVQCPCHNGDLWLQGGTVQGSGRVEVCVDNVWGTVCDDSWTELNARVVCKQLGFSVFGAHPLPCCATYGQGSGPIHMSDVRCTGAESSLINCSHTTSRTCSHSNDAAVQCQARSPCYGGDVRLVDGRYPHEGRLELCLNETWGTICDYISIYGWNRTEAKVVCKQLGYIGANVSTHDFGAGIAPVIIKNVHCRGTESSLAECVYTTSQNVCSRDKHGIVGVQCIQDVVKNGQLRLTDGLTRYEGRVEMYRNSEWRTICNDGWEEVDATVVCRQLNYLSISLQIKAIAYGQGYKGTSPLLANVGCTGSENNLANCCATRLPDNSQCHSRVYAGVRCAQCVENSIQLVGELSQSEGFVAICLGGSWGKVCGGDAQAAKVVCRQLGFSTKDPFVNNYECLFDVVSALPFLIANVQCLNSSHETQLSQCNYEHSGIAFCDNIFGIKCQLTEQSVPGAPLNVQVSSVTSSTIGLTWSPPLVSETVGLTIYSYAITCSNDAEMHNDNVKTTDARSTTFSQLRPFMQYNCCVAVNSNNGRGRLACLSAVTASGTGVDYHASSTALAIFFVMVSIALIAALTVLVYLHYKQCTPYFERLKTIISYWQRKPAENPAYDVDNPAYEFVETPSERNPGSKSENPPYQVTVLGALENTCSLPPSEYLTPSNTELITCNQCIEHGNPTGVCNHRRNPYQSLILTESICPTAYQELVQDNSLKEDRPYEPVQA